jgi:hypothetical protein
MCPKCKGITVCHNVSMAVVREFARFGLKPTRWRLPEELFERKPGPEIDHDDLLDFHNAIGDPEIFEKEIRKLRGDAR